MLLAGVLTFTYHQRKRRLNRLVKMAEGLEEKYLLSEMLPEPEPCRRTGLFSTLKNGVQIYAGTDWNSSKGETGVPGIY